MNKMKRYLMIVLAAALCLPLSAQKTTEEYLTRYNLLVGKLGPTGVGIETLINKWEADFPDNEDMLCAKFSYYFSKCMSSQVVKKDQKKFMGKAPLLSLDDSLGVKTNYFEEIFFEDSLYAMASQALDKAIREYPDDLELRLTKVTSLVSYEKESPDMATQTLLSLIDYNYTSKPSWVYAGAEVDPATFVQLVQDYCLTFYTIGSDTSMESFRKISERMSSYNPKNSQFLDNLGTYHLIARSDNKSALKYYSKALKLDPGDYTAIKNTVLIARRDKNVKLEKKYLPLLIKAAENEGEQLAAKARLEALNTK